MITFVWNSCREVGLNWAGGGGSPPLHHLVRSFSLEHSSRWVLATACWQRASVKFCPLTWAGPEFMNRPAHASWGPGSRFGERAGGNTCACSSCTTHTHTHTRKHISMLLNWETIKPHTRFYWSFQLVVNEIVAPGPNHSSWHSWLLCGRVCVCVCKCIGCTYGSESLSSWWGRSVLPSSSCSSSSAGWSV